MQRLSKHGNGIALIFARTETNTFFNSVWGKAEAALFLKGRLTFYNVDGTKGHFNGGAPSILIAYGENNAQALRNSTLPGYFVQLTRS